MGFIDGPDSAINNFSTISSLTIFVHKYNSCNCCGIKTNQNKTRLKITVAAEKQNESNYSNVAQVDK